MVYESRLYAGMSRDPNDRECDKYMLRRFEEVANEIECQQESQRIYIVYAFIRLLEDRQSLWVSIGWFSGSENARGIRIEYEAGGKQTADVSLPKEYLQRDSVIQRPSNRSYSWQYTYGDSPGYQLDIPAQAILKPVFVRIYDRKGKLTEPFPCYILDKNSTSTIRGNDDN